jgi:ribonuclease-3
MTTQIQLDVFQDRLGYRFSNPELLDLALTHASTGGNTNYERLEFLGDRVLGLVIANLLYKVFPDEHEGGLAKRHAALACTETLAQVAHSIDLPDIVNASRAERAAVGATQENMLADCMEAIIGAVYLDGGLPVCDDMIAALWGERVFTMHQPPMDSKTSLQEWAQERRLPIPVYAIVSKEGPDHAPFFTVSVTVKGFDPAQASGASRRHAEKEAAKILLERLENIS